MQRRKTIIIAALAIVLAGSALFVLSGEPGEQPLIDACKTRAIADGLIAQRNTYDLDFAVEELGDGRWTIVTRSFRCQLREGEDGVEVTASRL